MPSPAPATSLLLSSTLALIQQFTNSLSTPQPPSGIHPESSPSSLPLLSTATSALKAQATKLSLLSITAPFSGSAVSKTLITLNDTILPSLTTATLLLTPTAFTATF